MSALVEWRNGPRLRRVPPSDIQIVPPAVLLMDPKYSHNVGQVVRLACCWGVRSVAYTGSRVDLAGAVERIPREERMRDYASVDLMRYDRPFDILTGTPVAVEVRENAEDLTDFEHPRDAVYVFGPEDGGLGRVTLLQCHRFVSIPTAHCLNLSTAVATVLYDRHCKEQRRDRLLKATDAAQPATRAGA